MTHERIKVLVETEARAFRGYVHKPVKDDRYRLSDYLNTIEQSFLCLSDVTIHERGQQYRPGDSHAFIAVSLSAITYITPLDDGA